jgi:hypothetical protein
MDHLVLRHPSYMRGFTYPFSLSVGWPAGTTTLCRSQLYPPVRDYEFWATAVLQTGPDADCRCLIFYSQGMAPFLLLR